VSPLTALSSRARLRPDLPLSFGSDSLEVHLNRSHPTSRDLAIRFQAESKLRLLVP